MTDRPVIDYATPPGAAPISTRALWQAAGLAILGVLLLMESGQAHLLTPAEYIFAMLGVAMALPRSLTRNVMRLSQWLNGLTRKGQAILIVILAVALPAYLMAAAYAGHRSLVPLMHDEQMYLLQARQFASFHLAMPPLPMGEFFDTFYVFVKPVYASMYFPGTALAYVPSIWLGLPYCAWPLLIMTGLCLMTYLVAARLMGRFLSLVTLFAMLTATPMNWMPTATMSHPLGGLFGLIVIYAWMRWRTQPRIGWAILLGTAAGWMAITRPLESTAYGLPVLVAILCSIRRPTLALTLRHAATAVACTLPFLGLQAMTNHAVTGQWTKLPISQYVEQEFTGMSALGKASPDLKSTSTLPQKQAMMNAFVLPPLRLQARNGFWEAFQARLNLILATAIGSPLLIILLPLSLPLTRRSVEWRVILAIVITFTLAYGLYGDYLMQYSSQLMAPLAMLVVGSAAALIACFPAHADRMLTGVASAVAGITLVVIFLQPNNGEGTQSEWSVMRFNYSTLPGAVKKPALVLYRFGANSSPFIEPVYNIETAWPDDASIIRAHDFGPQRDLALFRYYAATQPQRNVYLFDRETFTLQPIGTVADLVAKADAASQRAK